MTNDNKPTIERLILGLNIFKMYKSDPSIAGLPNAKTVLQLQEEEFLEITDMEVDLLNSWGWRTENKMLWRLLTDDGLSAGIKEKQV